VRERPVGHERARPIDDRKRLPRPALADEPLTEEQEELRIVRSLRNQWREQFDRVAIPVQVQEDPGMVERQRSVTAVLIGDLSRNYSRIQTRL